MQIEYCFDNTTRAAVSLDYRVMFVTDAHSTFDSETLKAEQIIAHHNRVLWAFAHPTKAAEIFA